MNNHPDIHRHLHSARATELRAQARAWELRWTVGTNGSGRSGTSVRARLGWLLIEAGLRLLHSPAPPRPAEG
ncbi:hypothetical protein ACFYOF_20440 [Streptomyces sp. NPDC007148]|uniref:hypothetical protein n=1 Tax=unclassified Streptomyces TaxID=2593676 RepID=UPI003677B948